MPGRIPPSDLGSQWVTVPRQFRGIKSTSSPTNLAYVTPKEQGLLSQFANIQNGRPLGHQVGPANIPSYDDSGFRDPKYYTPTYPKTPPAQKIGGSYSFDKGAKGLKDAKEKGGFHYTPPTATTKDITRPGGTVKRKTVEETISDALAAQAPGSRTVKDATRNRITADKIKYGDKNGDKNGMTDWEKKFHAGVHSGTVGDDPPPRNGDDPPPPGGFDWSKITITKSGTEGPYGGDSGSFLSGTGNYHDTDPGKGNFTTVGGGRRGGNDPRVDYNGPGFNYWYAGDEAAILAYNNANEAEQRILDLQANVDANRPTGARSFSEFKAGGGGDDYQKYVDYLNAFEPTLSTGPTVGGDEGPTIKQGGNLGTGTISEAALQPMQMAELTDEMMLSNKITELINVNSPLFKAASTRAMQIMQGRGLANSSMAQTAVLSAVLDVVMPIAQQEVTAAIDAMKFNVDWTNKDRSQANAFYYQKMLTAMEYANKIVLDQISQGGQMGRLLLEEEGALSRQKISSLATIMSKEKADPESWATYWEMVGN